MQTEIITKLFQSNTNSLQRNVLESELSFSKMIETNMSCSFRIAACERHFVTWTTRYEVIALG